MNKFKILSLAAVCVGFVACDEVEDSLSQPQAWPQDPIFQATNLVVNTPDATFDLQALNDANKPAEVSTFSVTDFPANMYDLQLVMQISTDDTFADVYEVAAEVDSLGKVNVLPDAIQGVYYAHVTHNPVPGDLYVRYKANAVNGSETVRIGGPDVFYGAGKITVKPFDPATVIETAYYLVGTASDGTIAKGIKFDHSDVNQYDDPIFTVSYEITEDQAAAGFQWYIVPASTYAAGVISGDDTAFGPASVNVNALEGALSGTVTDGKPSVGIIHEVGPHLFTINMAKRTYDISLAIAAIYAYTSSPSAGYMLTTNDYVHYSGFAGMRQPFFRLSNLNSTSANMRWGQAIDNSGQPIPGHIELQPADATEAITLPQAGCYFLNVNLASLTYTADYIEYFGLIGGWDSWAGDVVMTHTDRYYMVWTAKLTITNGTEFKIRTNGSWDGANLGTPYGDQSNFNQLVEHGENLVWNKGDGTFTVTLDLSKVPYTLTAVKE